MSSQVIKIANCSGYYGDKLSAAKDMIDGGPIDVLTGDYLAELTMTILYNQKLQRGEDKGYVGTFLKQVKGKTLQDFCKVLEKEFNREQVERSTDKIGVAGLKPNSAGTAAAPKTQEFPDEIEFRLGSGSGPIAEQLKNAKIEPGFEFDLYTTKLNTKKVKGILIKACIRIGAVMDSM